jgi:hypothetical protein
LEKGLYIIVHDADLMRLSDTKVFALSLSLALLLAVVLVLWATAPPWSKRGDHIAIKVSPGLVSPGEPVRLDVWLFTSDCRVKAFVWKEGTTPLEEGTALWSWDVSPKEDHTWTAIYTRGWSEGLYIVGVNATNTGAESLMDTFRIVSHPTRILTNPRLWGAVLLTSAVAIYFLLVRRSPRSRR